MAKRQKSNRPQAANREARRQSRYEPKNIVPFPTTEDRAELDERYRKSKKQVRIEPQSVTQQLLLDALCDQDKALILATGPAGTGKTYVSTSYAIKELKAGDIEKIVITRPNVAVDDRTLGHLPGDINEKMAPWVQPFLDIFNEYYTKDQIRRMMESGVIEIVPTEFLRGRTFKNTIVLADECQNLSINGMKSLLTRIGENCRMIVAGDVEQSDQGQENGLSDFLDRVEENPMIADIEFSVDDVRRSPVVKAILKMYD